MIEAIRQRLNASLNSESEGSDAEKLVDIMEVLRPFLFDYLFRMTGKRPAVLRTMDETLTALQADAKIGLSDYEELLLQVFVTARNFAADSWNADTSELQNAAYAGDVSDGMELDLARLPGWQREALILSIRVEFSPEQIARIMSVPRDLVSEFITGGITKLQSAKRVSDDELRRAIRRLKAHPLEIDSGHPETMAFSQIMGDIEVSHQRVKRWRIITAVLVLLVVAGALSYYFR